MDFRHLRYFLAVAEELHFSRAAERLNMCQPPLSQQIKQLERELGAELFHRTKREVQLTEAGRMLVGEARLILAHVDRAVKAVGKANSGQIGQLLVGTVTSVESSFYNTFVEILQTFSRRYPGVQLELRRLSTAGQFEALRDGHLQVGFVTAAESDEDVAVERIERIPLVIALPEGHRLASLKTVDLEELATEPHIVLPRWSNPFYHDLLLRWFGSRGFTPNIAHESDTIQMVLTLVVLGSGVAVVPASMKNVDIRGVTFRRIREPVPRIQSGVAYRRDTQQSMIVRSFLSVVREVAAQKRMRKRPTLQIAAAGS